MKSILSRLHNVFAAVVLTLLGTATVAAGEGQIFTLWPLVDYRHSEAVDYTSLNLLGPLITYERKGNEREYGLRPLYFTAVDPEENIRISEYFYPVASRKSGPEHTSFQAFRLLDYDSDHREGRTEREFMLFPFLFSGTSRDGEDYFALFPLGGKLVDKFGRDRIHFALFPLYGRTEKKETVVTNVLWPVFAFTEGENETGVKIWPFYGHSSKEGVYEKEFLLWPIFFREEVAQNTANPTRRKGAFPFYLEIESPSASSTTWLWPFFSHVENREKDFEEWNFPWPLVRRTTGSHREGVRVLPFYSDERIGPMRKRWFVWPIYRIEEIQTELLDRRRDRILFFLYSDLREVAGEEAHRQTRRVALWPLFTYEKEGAVSRFHTLSILEPFFPGREGIERNWGPLYRIYQRKWDTHGNEISSFLWNLYWKERRGRDVALELFPVFFYRQEGDEQRELSVLKGFVRYTKQQEGRKLHLLFLPWGVPLGAPAQEGK